MKDKNGPSVLVIVTDEAGVTTTIDTSQLTSAHSLGGHILHAVQRMQAAFAPEVQRTVDDLARTYEEAMRVWDMLKKILAGAGTPEGPGDEADEAEITSHGTSGGVELSNAVVERLAAEAEEGYEVASPLPDETAPDEMDPTDFDSEIASAAPAGAVDPETMEQLVDERQGTWAADQPHTPSWKPAIPDPAADRGLF